MSENEIMETAEEERERERRKPQRVAKYGTKSKKRGLKKKMAGNRKNV